MENDGSVLTIDEALQFVGFGKYQVFLLAYAGMGWVSEAMEMMLLSFVGPSVHSEWELTPQQESLISSAVFVGMLVGAFLWGILSDIKGRRYGFFATAMVIFSAGLLSSFSPNYVVLVSLRCSVGVGIGGGHVFCAWFLEFIPVANRGIWMVVFQAFWTFGTLLEATIAWIVMPNLGWRWLLGISATPLLVLLLFYSVVPESPRYLLMKGRKTDALQILNKIAHVNKKQLLPGTYVAYTIAGMKDVDAVDKQEEAHLLDVNRQQCENSIKTRNKAAVISTLCTLVAPSLITSTLILWFVFFANAFGYYGLVLLTSQLSSDSEYCASETISSTTNKSSLYRDVLITSCGEIPGLLMAATIVDSFGRKRSMAALFFSCCVFVLPLIFPLHEVTTTILLFGARTCIVGTNTIAYIYAPEVYPTPIRSTGIGTASSFGRIGGVLCPIIAVFLVKTCHLKLAIFLFEFVLISAAISVFFLPKETKGQTLTDFV